MERVFLDTNVILRFLTQDNPDMAARARGLFRAMESGSVALILPEAVLVELVQVLSSPRLYHLPRQEVVRLLEVILSYPGVQIASKSTYLRALDLWAQTPVDFVDALLVAHMERQRVRAIASFDRDFDRFPQVQRREP